MGWNPDQVDAVEHVADYSETTFPELRAFQVSAHASLQQGARDGHRCQVLMASTGAGKSLCGMRLIHQSMLKGKKAMFLCDRIALVNQASRVADQYGLSDHGVIMAGHWRYAPSLPFQIASAQTMERRAWPDLDLLIVDECQDMRKSWVEFVKTCRAKVVGLSASPFTKGLGKLFTNLVNATTMHDLTEAGILVPLRFFQCKRVNMRGAETAGGEWTDNAACERGMEIIGDVVTEWLDKGESRKSICFGTNVAHCEELCRNFNQAGVMAAVYCYNTTDKERDIIMDEYRKPDSAIRVLISVDALSKGFDLPDVSCAIDVRAHRKGFSNVIQKWGRVARCSPETGKIDAIILDHSGNSERFAEDFEHLFYNGLDKLDDGEKLDKTIRQEPEDREQKGCPKCGHRPFFKHCVACGHEITKTSLVEHLPGEMQEVCILNRNKEVIANGSADLWAQCCSYSRSIGNPETANARARHAYRAVMKADPPKAWRFDDAPSVPVSPALKNKILHERIRWVRGQKMARRPA